MLSFARWAAGLFACFVCVGACALDEGTDPGTLPDASTDDGGICDPTTCPGVDNVCGQRTCVNNKCAMAYLPAGPANTAQVAGDCRTDMCDGKGSLASQIDNADIPDDKNPCTNDICTNGVPSNTNGPAGVTCAAGPPPLLCNANGQCVGCVKPTDCPGTDTECGTRTCSAQGICGNNFAAAGKALATQVAGDCHTMQCDGKGTAVSVVANGDVPVDGNPCTNDICVLGSPSNPNSALNAPCPVNKFCNGAGTCVQCNAANQCAGSDTFCGVRTCASNVCGMSYTSAGTATPTQVTGDCKENQCNGAGGVTPAPKPGDLPVDNNDCTSDVCNNGTPSNPPTALGTACNVSGKTKCNGAGVCVQCNAPADCPQPADSFCGTATCNGNVCGMTYQSAGTPLPTGQTPGDCKENQCNGSGAVNLGVTKDSDLPIDGNDCTDDVCTNGVPTNPDLPNNTPCSSNGGTKCTNGMCK